jgi:hypothetical protein
VYEIPTQGDRRRIDPCAHAGARRTRPRRRRRRGPGRHPLVKKKKGWKYKSFEATSCWLGGPPFSQKPNVFFGTPNGVRCAVAYVTVSGVVAYNGKQASGQSINASGGGIGGALKGGASVKTTWKGFVNNGAKKSLAGSGKYMQLGANFQVDLVYRNFNSFMRINVYPNGKARLAGYVG